MKLSIMRQNISKANFFSEPLCSMKNLKLNDDITQGIILILLLIELLRYTKLFNKAQTVTRKR